jgi:hypothetical protein
LRITCRSVCHTLAVGEAAAHGVRQIPTVFDIDHCAYVVRNSLTEVRAIGISQGG